MNIHLKELAELIRSRAANAPLAKPKLRLVAREDLFPAPVVGLDPQSKDIIYSRIRDLSRMYWLAWLVRQETVHVGGIVECLDDAALLNLLNIMERARECRVEGIGFDEAGLVRNMEAGQCSDDLR